MSKIEDIVRNIGIVGLKLNAIAQVVDEPTLNKINQYLNDIEDILLDATKEIKNMDINSEDAEKIKELVCDASMRLDYWHNKKVEPCLSEINSIVAKYIDEKPETKREQLEKRVEMLKQREFELKAKDKMGNTDWGLVTAIYQQIAAIQKEIDELGEE